MKRFMKRGLMAAAVVASMMGAAACGGAKSDTASADSVQVDEAAFEASQPIPSGEYYAVRYDIEGPKARKGQFDGRLMASLSPEISALYIYENGNRTKIDCKVILERPFEKGDSGIYRSVDTKGLPVELRTDSLYVITFSKGDEKYSIGFDAKPKSEASAFDMQQRINEQVQKNK